MLKAIVSILATTIFVAGAVAAELVPLEVMSARPIVDPITGTPVVEITLSDDGRATFAEFSSENVGKRVDVLVDDDVMTSPVIQTPLDMRVMQISGLDTMAIATDIATRLRGKKAQVFVRPTED
mgnify:CR=1 FL=1